MGVLTVQNETATAVAPVTMFKVFILEADKYIPKIIPHTKIEVLEGNGGPGTIKKTTFSGQDSGAHYIKIKIETIDKDNLTYSYTIFGGEPWMDSLEKSTVEVKVEAAANGGSIVKSTNKYFPKENCQLDEEKIKIGGEKALGMFKTIEAYILANPDACN